MFVISNYPGSSNHDYEWYPNTKEGKEFAKKMEEKYWARGQCAWPIYHLSDKKAKAAKFRDGTRVYNFDRSCSMS
jgi:hypothetical protein